MRVRVSVRHIFLLLMHVRACVCVLFYIIFFHHGMYFFRINFQIHLISHALRLAGSVSIGAVVGF